MFLLIRREAGNPSPRVQLSRPERLVCASASTRPAGRQGSRSVRVMKRIGSRTGSTLLADQLSQQGKILQVAVRGEVEIARDLLQFFLLDRLLVPLHESLVGPPRDAGGLYRGPLRADRDLMRVQIGQAKLVQKRLLHDLVGDQIRRHVNAGSPGAERPRKMAIYIDRPPVLAVAGDVGNIL